MASSRRAWSAGDPDSLNWAQTSANAKQDMRNRRRICALYVLGGLVATLLSCTQKPAPEASYVPPDTCRTCHAEIAATYQHVAMARSLYRPTVPNVIEDYHKNNSFYHAPSARYYRMTERQGRFYQERYQINEGREEINKIEVEVRYVIGSGNHA